MEYLVFDLDTIQPKSFYGEQNKHIDLLKKHFLKLKIVARSSQIKVYGSQSDLIKFETTISKLLEEYRLYESIPTRRFEQILCADLSAEDYWKGHKDVLLYKTSGKPIKALNESQREFIDLANKNDMVFALGVAGTGKTYISIAMAVRALKDRKIKRIILTRPAVEAGENLGFLPGDIKDKLDPYMQPLYDALFDMVPQRKLDEYIENRTIEIAPLAFMRGRTLDEAFVILDEAQNTTSSQMKMFLTRMGKTAKFIITGDPSQVDLIGKTISGLKEAVHVLKNIEGVGTIYLSEKDVVRHPLVKEIIHAYNRKSI